MSIECSWCGESKKFGDKCEKCSNDTKTDFDIAKDFFNMLKKHGVKVKIDDDHGPELLLFDYICPGNAILEFCFYEDGSYWRIMGYPEKDYYSDEIHKEGWK